MIAHELDSSETKEILAIESAADESEDSWRTFLQKPKRLGLKRACLFILNAHIRFQAAIKKELQEASLWHKVHLMMSILASLPHRDMARFCPIDDLLFHRTLREFRVRVQFHLGGQDHKIHEQTPQTDDLSG